MFSSFGHAHGSCLPHRLNGWQALLKGKGSAGLVRRHRDNETLAEINRKGRVIRCTEYIKDHTCRIM